MKVVFLTDAHLGAEADSKQRELEICQFLDTLKGNTDVLVLLGDMFDFWFSYKEVVPRGHVRILGKLAELTDSGIALHYFIGNHDMWIFDYLEKEIGAIMHDEPTVMTFGTHTFLIGHGDGLGHLDRKYDLLRHIFRSRTNQKLFQLLPSRLTFGIAHRWSHHSRNSHDEGNLRYLGDQQEGIVIWCKEQLKKQHIDYCVFGHRHTPVSKKIITDTGVESHYINVGDWLIHKNYAVYENGTMNLITL